MTNYEYLINSDKRTVAEILTTLTMQLYSKTTDVDELSQSMIELEVLSFMKWLDTDIVEGEYLN